MQNEILQLLENPFISCPFCLQKGVLAHTCLGQKGTSSLQPASVHVTNPGFKCMKRKLLAISTQACYSDVTLGCRETH